MDYIVSDLLGNYPQIISFKKFLLEIWQTGVVSADGD